MRCSGIAPRPRQAAVAAAPARAWPCWRGSALVLGCFACAAAATVTEHMDITCAQQPVESLSCDYRLRNGGVLGSAVAEYDGRVMAGTSVADYPESGDLTAVMVLIDTSDPARQPVVDRIVVQLRELLEHALPHHRFGLASFDTDLYLLADIGTAPVDILRAASELKAKGRTTELYRNVREAVRLLGRRDDVARRALLIMSDGLAEDYAYHHEDVVQLALDERVVIHSIGYPRSVAQSVALQTLRRLSDETGGLYVQAQHVDFSIPDGVFARLLAATDSGGRVAFALGPLIEAGIGGAIDLSLAFQTPAQSFIVLAPVRLPGINPATDAGNDSPANVVPAAPLVRPPFRPALVPPAPTPWPWFVALLTLTALTLISVVWAIRRGRHGIAAAPAAAGGKAGALAYLVMQDGRQQRHAIDKTPWRIGRGHSNDLTINDHSVSRLHAEIRANDEGSLLLKDLESLNGVFVNDNRIESIQLREGDEVDIGDVRMQFTLHDEAYATEEPTVLVRTHTPR